MEPVQSVHLTTEHKEMESLVVKISVLIEKDYFMMEPVKNVISLQKLQKTEKVVELVYARSCNEVNQMVLVKTVQNS